MGNQISLSGWLATIHWNDGNKSLCCKNLCNGNFSWIMLDSQNHYIAEISQPVNLPDFSRVCRILCCWLSYNLQKISSKHLIYILSYNYLSVCRKSFDWLFTSIWSVRNLINFSAGSRWWIVCKEWLDSTLMINQQTEENKLDYV